MVYYDWGDALAYGLFGATCDLRNDPDFSCFFLFSPVTSCLGGVFSDLLTGSYIEPVPGTWYYINKCPFFRLGLKKI